MTLENFALSIILFTFEFSFLCWLFREPQTTETPQLSIELKSNSEPDFYYQVKQMLTEEIEEKIKPETELVAEIPDNVVNQAIEVETPLSPEKPSLNVSLTTEEYVEEAKVVTLQSKSVLSATATPSQIKSVLETLNIRELRKLCKPLGVQQKRNSVHKKKQILLGEIKRIARDNSNLVQEAIASKLPEKLERKVQVEGF